MTRRTIERTARIAAMVGIFAAGWLGGSVTQRNADAQMGG